SQRRKQTGGEVNTIKRSRREICRGPRSHFQIKGVHMTCRAGEQDEDRILSAVEHGNRSLSCSRLGAHVQWRDEIARNTCACDLEKYPTIDDHGSLPGSVVKNEFEFVHQRPLNGFRATRVS